MPQLSAALIQQIHNALIAADHLIQQRIPGDQRTGQPTFYALAASEVRRLDRATSVSWSCTLILDAVLALPDYETSRSLARALLPMVIDRDGLLSAPAAHTLNDYLIPGDSWALEPLLAVLDATRAAAAQGNPQADPPASLASIWAVGALRDRRPVPTLIALLNYPDQMLARAAATVLGELGDRRAVTPLIAAVRTARNSDAAIALGRLEAREAFEALLEQWHWYVDEEMTAVAQGIPTNTVEQDATVELMFGALAQALGRLGRQEAIQPLASFIPFMYNYDQVVRIELAIALHRLGDGRAFARITEALTDHNVAMRQRPARYLLERGDERALPTLIDSYLQDEDDIAGRQSLIRTLDRFGDRWDVPLLLWIQQHDHTLSETEGWPLSTAATRAIARITARQNHIADQTSNVSAQS